MAVAHRDTQTATTGSTPANSLTVNLPTGTAVNDQLLACINVDGGTGATITAPSGWIIIPNGTSTDGTNTKMIVYWRLADGSETSTYQWTFDTTRQAAGSISAYSGGYPFRPPQGAGSTNGVASTTMVPAASNPSYTGMFVEFFGHRNTTAAATITPGATYTERADVCTTASAFIGVEVQEVANAFPLISNVVNNSTASQSVTFSNVLVQIADNHGLALGNSGMQIDYFSAGSRNTSGANVSAIRMSTNYVNEVLLAFVAIPKDAQTVTSVTGNSLTWVNVGRTNTQTGSVEIWRALQASVVSAPSAYSVTANFSASVVSANIIVIGMVNADLSGSNGSGAIGATNNANGTSSAPTASITTTRNNSWVMGLASNATQNIAFTAGTNQTKFRGTTDGVNTASSAMNYQNAVTPASGTSVTINWTNSMTSWNEFIFEVLPAPSGSFLDFM